MSNLFCVKDKVVVITGGAGILGSHIATYLAGEDAKVVILDRDEKKGKQLVSEIKTQNKEAFFLFTDVLNQDILESNKNEILERYGRIDALLNAAGGNMARSEERRVGKEC